MISVICPVYNEQDYIQSLLEFFIHAAPAEKELILVDGGSTDHTIELIQAYASNHKDIFILHNPHKYVPFALNLAIKMAKGDVIIRLDAHTSYAPDYLTCILDCFEKTKAEIVGGPMRAIGKTPFQKAVAYATSTPMGVGNSNFHFENFQGFTDSVYLGAWKKEIFSRTGLFDESLVRNQDDEFHYRAKSLGYRVYQDPSITSHYYPRNSAVKLLKQYYGYGLYKPLVLKKIRTEVKPRHLVPAAFVVYLFSLIFIHNLVWLLPLMLYLVAALYFTIRFKGPMAARLLVPLCFPILHIAYGAGFIAGLRKLIQRPDAPGFLRASKQQA
jgi:succinoglycan biosynthesis protein ExoA